MLTGFNFTPPSCFDTALDDKTTEIKKRQYLDINNTCQVLQAVSSIWYISKASKFGHDSIIN